MNCAFMNLLSFCSLSSLFFCYLIVPFPSSLTNCHCSCAFVTRSIDKQLLKKHMLINITCIVIDGSYYIYSYPYDWHPPPHIGQTLTSVEHEENLLFYCYALICTCMLKYTKLYYGSSHVVHQYNIRLCAIKLAVLIQFRMNFLHTILQWEQLYNYTYL